MKIAITGICGFVGSELALQLCECFDGARIAGIDNFSRPGSETTRARLKAAGAVVKHGDIRCPSDLDVLDEADWVVDAAAQPSVLAGVDGRTSSRQAVDHNLAGTLNVLEFCKQRGAGLVLLSTSRVYSVKALSALPLVVDRDAFVPDRFAAWPAGASPAGVAEDFSTAAPVSLYGATKVASEVMAVEYGHAFGLPVVINRCGVSGRWPPVRDCGTGHFFVLGSRVGRGPPAHVPRLRWDGPPGTRRTASDRPRVPHRQPDSPGGRGGRNLERRRRRAELDVAGAVERMVRRAIRPANGPRRRESATVGRAVAGDRPCDGCSDRFRWAPSRGVTDILAEIADHHQRHPDWLSLTEPF